MTMLYLIATVILSLFLGYILGFAFRGSKLRQRWKHTAKMRRRFSEQYRRTS